MGDSEYSFSLTTFSPSGKLVQIEYALNAVAAGSTSLGIKATNGVVIATEKKVCVAYADTRASQEVHRHWSPGLTLTPSRF
jgi:20S proteasome subunit alpha 2